MMKRGRGERGGGEIVGGGVRGFGFPRGRGEEERGHHIPSIFIIYFFCDISLIKEYSNGLVSRFLSRVYMILLIVISKGRDS